MHELFGNYKSIIKGKTNVEKGERETIKLNRYTLLGKIKSKISEEGRPINTKINVIALNRNNVEVSV